MSEAVERPRLRLVPGGSSNSRRTLKSENGSAAGIDTIRLRLRDVDVSWRERLARKPHSVGSLGEVYVQEDGARWGSFPDGLAYVEGRVAALLDGPEVHYLATPADVVEVATRFADTVGGDADDVVLGRLDLASELRFNDPREGLGLMRAMSALDVPWLKTGTEGSKRDGLETVAWRTVNGRSVQFRLYDKGRESGIAEPGTLLRGERQKRMRKGRELPALEVPNGNLGDLYVGRELRTFALSERTVTVCDTPTAVDLLSELARVGRVKCGTADLLAGFLVRGRRHDEYPLATWYRRWAQLRELGIAVDDQVREVVNVPVGRYFGQLADAWAVAA